MLTVPVDSYAHALGIINVVGDLGGMHRYVPIGDNVRLAVDGGGRMTFTDMSPTAAEKGVHIM